LKQIIKSLIPPILLDTIKRFKVNKYGWEGNYSTWQEAQKDSIGYDSDKIIEAVKTSVLKVKNGEAVYERDSVIFDEIHYSWPLLAGLMYAFANEGGEQGCLILVEA